MLFKAKETKALGTFFFVGFKTPSDPVTPFERSGVNETLSSLLVRNRVQLFDSPSIQTASASFGIMKAAGITEAKPKPRKAIALILVALMLGAGFGFRLLTKAGAECQSRPGRLATDEEFAIRDNLRSLIVISTFRWLDSSTRSSVKKRVLDTAAKYPTEKAGISFSESEMKIANLFDLTPQFRLELISSIFTGVSTASTPAAERDRNMVERFADEARSVAAGRGKCLPSRMFDRETPYQDMFPARA